MADLFSGGITGSTSQSSQMPGFIEDQMRHQFDKGNINAQIGYLPYSGPQVAAFTPQQELAMQNNVSAGQAFGLAPEGMDAMAGMPESKTFAGGIEGYSGMPLMMQGVNKLYEIAPGFMENYDQLWEPNQPGERGAYNHPRIPETQQAGGGGGQDFQMPDWLFDLINGQETPPKSDGGLELPPPQHGGGGLVLGPGGTPSGGESDRGPGRRNPDYAWRPGGFNPNAPLPDWVTNGQEDVPPSEVYVPPAEGEPQPGDVRTDRQARRGRYRSVPGFGGGIGGGIGGFLGIPGGFGGFGGFGSIGIPSNGNWGGSTVPGRGGGYGGTGGFAGGSGGWGFFGGGGGGASQPGK